MKRILILLTVCLLILPVYGCGRRDTAKPARIGIDPLSESEVPEYILSDLIDIQKENYYAFGDSVIYLVATLGEKPTAGYSIRFIEYTANDDQTWDVYLESKAPGKKDSVAQVLTYPSAYARIYTNPELPVTGVRFHVNGKLVADLEVAELAYPSDERIVDLYFGTTQAYLRKELRPVPKEFDSGDTVTQAGILYGELQKGSMATEGMIQVIPEGTKLLGMTHKESEKLLEMTVSSHFGNAQGSAGELLAVYSLVNTLVQLEKVDFVTIVIKDGYLMHMDQLERMSFNEDLVE